MFYFTYIHPTQSTRLGPNSGWGKSQATRSVVVVEDLRRVHTRAVMRLECVFDPDPCVHARCALLCIPMRISEATSGGGFSTCDVPRSAFMCALCLPLFVIQEDS